MKIKHSIQMQNASDETLEELKSYLVPISKSEEIPYSLLFWDHGG